MSALTAAECAEPHRLGARLLYINALGFVDAARGLHELSKQPGNLPHPFVFFVNLGFAYELSLKAFLTHRKTTLNLRRDIGHDLLAALREAKAAGYIPFPGVEEELAVLGPLHRSPDEIRYLQDKSVDLPDPPDASLLLARMFMDDIGRQTPISDLGDWD
jgi:hypothetical protein